MVDVDSSSPTKFLRLRPCANDSQSSPLQPGYLSSQKVMPICAYWTLRARLAVSQAFVRFPAFNRREKPSGLSGRFQSYPRRLKLL